MRYKIRNATTFLTRADFYLFKRRGRKISGGVQAAPLSELWKGLGVWIIGLSHKIGGLK
jgi:hypothetical protein